MRIAVTGHRPNRLGGYDAHKNFQVIKCHMRAFLENLQDDELILISGGALGIDQFWIEVGLELNFPVIAALPFKGYNARWPRTSRAKYEKLLDKCAEVKYICKPGYKAQKLQKRNIWMVDNSDILVAYWDGSPGGTRNCLYYARKVAHHIYTFDLHDILSSDGIVQS